jgi:hypothetical protein
VVRIDYKQEVEGRLQEWRSGQLMLPSSPLITSIRSLLYAVDSYSGCVKAFQPTLNSATCTCSFPNLSFLAPTNIS